MHPVIARRNEKCIPLARHVRQRPTGHHHVQPAFDGPDAREPVRTSRQELSFAVVQSQNVHQRQVLLVALEPSSNWARHNDKVLGELDAFDRRAEHLSGIVVDVVQVLQRFERAVRPSLLCRVAEAYAKAVHASSISDDLHGAEETDTTLLDHASHPCDVKKVLSHLLDVQIRVDSFPLRHENLSTLIPSAVCRLTPFPLVVTIAALHPLNWARCPVELELFLIHLRD
mmetsp:Transcript_702/g.1906  ORF Transcript_702/g.1906 Transcript_702/m.1906 type:complete len:228 (+) Transcript_702:343-1026(+)